MDVIFWSSDHPESNYSFYRYIGPYKLSHWLKKHDYSSQVIDFVAHFTVAELYLATKKFITTDTIAIGISTTFLSNHVYIRKNGTPSRLPEHLEIVARMLKKEFPNLKIVLGGYGADSVYMDGIPDASIMSYTSSNEDVFLEYLDHYKKGTKLPVSKIITNFSDTSNPLKHRKWYDTPRNITYNIEEDDFKFSKNDCILQGEALPLDVSRGCIFACRFCNYPHLGKKKLDYIRGMDYIKEELIYNYNNFGTTSYMILDDTFNDTTIKLGAFKDMTDSLPFKITYTAYIRADLIQRFPEMAHMLKESGLQGAVHGIESLHPYASNLIGKAWSGKSAKEYLPELYHNIWNGEVAQQLNFIVGLPKETKEDIWDTLRWASQNDMYGVHFSALGIHPPSVEEKKFFTHTMSNEFGRNPEKYGFTFDEFGRWKNETWEMHEAIAFHKVVLAYISKTKLSKINVWSLGNLSLLGGYDIKQMLTTPFKDYDGKSLMQLCNNKYREYYNNLMSL